MRQDAPDLRLEIPDRILVVHVKDLAGQHAMPVLHRFVVLAIVEDELIHVVREILALAEELLVAAEAAVERVAPCVDDTGIGQDQVGEPHVREVVGQLVGEPCPAGRAVQPRCLEVSLAERAEVLAAQVQHGLRIFAVLPTIAAGRDGDLAELW